jgi:hypothetical protein
LKRSRKSLTRWRLPALGHDVGASAGAALHDRHR